MLSLHRYVTWFPMPHTCIPERSLVEKHWTIFLFLQSISPTCDLSEFFIHINRWYCSNSLEVIYTTIHWHIFVAWILEYQNRLLNCMGCFYMQHVILEHMAWIVVFIVECAWIQKSVTTWMEHVWTDVIKDSREVYARKVSFHHNHLCFYYPKNSKFVH